MSAQHNQVQFSVPPQCAASSRTCTRGMQGMGQAGVEGLCSAWARLVRTV